MDITFSNITTAIATVVIPVVLAYLGHIFSKAIKEKDLSARYIELAVGILKQAPTPNNQNLRKWAVDLINAYSKVPIDERIAKEFADFQIQP
jgi:hypothetical protein